jgi:hypothetical protein
MLCRVVERAGAKRRREDKTERKRAHRGEYPPNHVTASSLSTRRGDSDRPANHIYATLASEFFGFVTPATKLWISLRDMITHCGGCNARKTWDENISERKPQLAVFTVAPFSRRRNATHAHPWRRSQATYLFEKGTI